jgi:hypothetical protein
MAGRSNQLDHNAAIARVAEIVQHAPEVRAHLQEVVESRALRGSKRSQEFLKFIVDRALDGRFDALKERIIGVELFDRNPTYDTAEDAIVRVTACELRRRLTQFYSDAELHSEFRIDLPAGSYIPEFRRIAPAPERPEPVVPVEVQTIVAAPRRRISNRLLMAGGVAVLLACAALVLGQHSTSASTTSRALPWSAVLQPNRQTHVVFCDPEIVVTQRLMNYSVSLSDYANQRYWPPLETQPAAVQNTMQSVPFKGVSVAAVDAAMTARISNLVAPGSGNRIETHPARSLRLADFKSEDSFILFGSPRSNPWVALFQDQLDFRFQFDDAAKAEFILNQRPKDGEAPRYVPTAQGWGTGDAYAIVALVDNPNQKGQVLILAGSNAEATEAAGKLVTNSEALGETLKSHGIPPGGPVRHFEILLRVSTMAGSSNTFDVIACHLLG